MVNTSALQAIAGCGRLLAKKMFNNGGVTYRYMSQAQEAEDTLPLPGGKGVLPSSSQKPFRVSVRRFLRKDPNSPFLTRRESPSPPLNQETYHQHPKTLTTSTSGATAAPVAAEKGDGKISRVVTVTCGFSKDMLFGSSPILDENCFGDDAYFVAEHSAADVVGVADGVGGWRSHGVDPSLISRSLMQLCAHYVDKGLFQPNKPAALLASAHRELERAASNVEPPLKPEDLLMGSSTACVLMVSREDGILHTANLGDSGFLVLRGGRVVHRSEEQQHSFNTPFQLAVAPLMEGENGQKTWFLSDRAESADLSSFPLQNGDLIILATDGLFDNLPLHLIESELSGLKLHPTVAELQATCNSLALQAHRLAFDQQHMSPFAQKAQLHGYADAVGGKPDDITLLLILIQSLYPSP